MQHRADLQLVEQLVMISGEKNVIAEASEMEDYSHDMADYQASPAIVVKPGTEQEVVEIAQLAHRTKIPILPRGAGTSLTGAAVLDGAIVLDMRRMTKILKVDTVNWYVQVQSGISLE